jgi:hypothetical protein
MDCFAPSGLESDAAWFGFRLRHEFTNGFEDDTKLAIVLLLQLVEAPGKPLVRGDQLSKLNKRSHNGNVHLAPNAHGRFCCNRR